MNGSISAIESMGLVDGPGIRVVVFLSSCKLRCKYCHNPETWVLGEMNYTPQKLVDKIIRYKSYFKNNGGVTFSGGDPIMQPDFLIETCKLLKKEGIHIALDTAGCGIGKYKEILEEVDLVIFDVKHVDRNSYKELTGTDIDESLNFIKYINESNKPIWIRQVIVPDFNDNIEYIKSLKEFIQNINNVKRVDFLPYSKLGDNKYDKFNIINPYKDKPAMDMEKCKELYKEYLKLDK